MNGRKLRKLEDRLLTVRNAITFVEHSNPVPEHEPSSLVVIQQRLAPLRREQQQLQRQISMLMGRDQ